MLHGRAGFVAGYERGWLGLRLHLVTSWDQVSVVEGVDEQPESKGSLVLPQRVVGGSVTLWRWARFGIDHVHTGTPWQTGQKEGLLVTESSPTVPSNYVLASISVPRFALATEGLLSTETGAVDLARIGSTRLRLADTAILTTISTAYIRDERQVTTLAGLTIQGWYAGRTKGLSARLPEVVRRTEVIRRGGVGIELGGEASGEYRSGRLRQARLRSEGFVVFAEHVVPSPHAPAYSHGYARASMFLEATHFGSAYFSDRTGRSRVYGGGGGLEGMFGNRFMTLAASLYFGANRPETLERMSEAATLPEMRAQIYTRGGW